MKIELIIEEELEANGYEYHGYCKNIKGIHVPGDTPEDTLESLGEALTAYSKSLIKHDEELKDYIEEEE